MLETMYIKIWKNLDILWKFLPFNFFFRENEELAISEDLQKAVEELSQGLLSIYQPPLEQLEKELKELT